MSSLKDYTVNRQVGAGKFAFAVSAIHKQTNKKVAIKIMDKSELIRDDALQAVYDEIEIMKKIDHPFICKYFDSFETTTRIYIVMEFAEGGTLLNYVNSLEGLTENDALTYFVQIMQAIKYLHQTCHVAHRDIKGENIMIDQYGMIRVIDFGLSKLLEGQNSLMTTKCGSPQYVSPEVIHGENYTMASDVWALGVLLYSIVAFKLPFESVNMKYLFDSILYKEVNYPSSFSEPLTNLLSHMLVKDPMFRITLDKIMEHPWVNQRDITDIAACESVKIPDEDVFSYLNTCGYDINECMQSLEKGLNTKSTVAFNIVKRELEAKEVFNTFNKVKESTKNSMVYQSSSQKIPLLKSIYPIRQAKVPIYPANRRFSLTSSTALDSQKSALKAKKIAVPVIKKSQKPKCFTPVRN